MQGVSIRRRTTNAAPSTRYTDSATYDWETITVMVRERNGGFSGAITVTININGREKRWRLCRIPQVFRPCIRPAVRLTPLHLSWISASLRVRVKVHHARFRLPLVMVSGRGVTSQTSTGFPVPFALTRTNTTMSRAYSLAAGLSLSVLFFTAAVADNGRGSGTAILKTRPIYRLPRPWAENSTARQRKTTRGSVQCSPPAATRPGQSALR